MDQFDFFLDNLLELSCIEVPDVLAVNLEHTDVD